MTKGTLRYFAIRNGDFVEFRAASNPPRARVSKLSKSIKVQEIDHWISIERYPFSKAVMKTVEKPVVLKQTFFVGGRFLFSRRLKTWNTFRTKFKIHPLNNGKLVEIEADAKDFFKSQTSL